jgi:hypothetical protein
MLSKLSDYLAGRIERRTLLGAVFPGMCVAYFGMLALAARLFPHDYDWRVLSISQLLYPRQSPEFYWIAASGVTLAGALMLPFAGYLERQLAGAAPVGAKAGCSVSVCRGGGVYCSRAHFVASCGRTVDHAEVAWGGGAAGGSWNGRGSDGVCGVWREGSFPSREGPAALSAAPARLLGVDARAGMGSHRRATGDVCTLSGAGTAVSGASRLDCLALGILGAGWVGNFVSVSRKFGVAAAGARGGLTTHACT